MHIYSIYIHIDTAHVLHVNVGLAQARPNNLTDCPIPMRIVVSLLPYDHEGKSLTGHAGKLVVLNLH